jgi:hypothetical protein
MVLEVRSPLVFKGDLTEAYAKIAEHARSKGG